MIYIWMIFLIISVVAVIVEIFMPTMFCINFAFSGIIVSLVSIFWGNLWQLFALFILLSLLFIIFLKPVLVKFTQKAGKSDFRSQYIGRIVKTITPVTATSGAVSIYDERWEARLQDVYQETIPENTDVKIVGNDSTIFYIERI